MKKLITILLLTIATTSIYGDIIELDNNYVYLDKKTNKLPEDTKIDKEHIYYIVDSDILFLENKNNNYYMKFFNINMKEFIESFEYKNKPILYMTKSKKIIINKYLKNYLIDRDFSLTEIEDALTD
jgi:signal peptidase I